MVEAQSESSTRVAVRFVVAGQRRALAALAATAFAGGVAEALFLVAVTRSAFAITAGADRVGIVGGRFATVNQALLVALSLIVLRVGLAAFAAWQSARLSAATVGRVRHRLAAAFLEASWETQQAQRAGSLQELLSGFSSHASALMTSVSQIVLASANLVALIAIAIAVDPVGAIVLVASVSALGGLLRPIRSIVRRRARVASEAGMALATAVGEISQLGLELHVFHVQDAAKSRVGELIDAVQRNTNRLQIAAGLTSPLYTGLAYLAVVGALAVAAASDSASLTSLGAAMLVMLRSLSYGQSLQGAYTSVSSSVPVIEELMRRQAAYDGGRRTSGGEVVPRVLPVVAEGVWFSYEDERDVLKNVSFIIEPHEIVGIIGPSGSGKSTLVQLLLGLRDPRAGTIHAAGRDISGVDRADWARRVTFVPQASRLIAGSVADNVRFLRTGVTDEDIERATRLAHLHEEIVSLPGGFDRQVGEHGGHLSGGQQQRLCIARALVEQPELLILDEPTSALDVRSENLIRTTILELRQRMTVVIIAHRLSTLEMCDRIMVLQDGEVRGFANPADLEASNEFYRDALVLSGLR